MRKYRDLERAHALEESQGALTNSQIAVVLVESHEVHCHLDHDATSPPDMSLIDPISVLYTLTATGDTKADRLPHRITLRNRIDACMRMEGAEENSRSTGSHSRSGSSQTASGLHFGSQRRYWLS
jgi:hypothetical protein